MTTDQIVTELRRIRYGQYPTITRVAKAAGLSRMAVYRAVQSGTLSSNHAEALGKALRTVTDVMVRQPPVSDRY